MVLQKGRQGGANGGRGEQAAERYGLAEVWSCQGEQRGRQRGGSWMLYGDTTWGYWREGRAPYVENNEVEMTRGANGLLLGRIGNPFSSEMRK